MLLGEFRSLGKQDVPLCRKLSSQLRGLLAPLGDSRAGGRCSQEQEETEGRQGEHAGRYPEGKSLILLKVKVTVIEVGRAKESNWTICKKRKEEKEENPGIL